MTFSRNWVPLKSLSEQPATQSQGETVANASALYSDAVMEQVVSIWRTVIDYSFSSWWRLAPWLLMSRWASIYPLMLLWEQSSEFFLSCKTGALYPLNNSLSPPHPLVLVVLSILPRRLHSGRWRNSAPAISPSTQIPVCSRALSYSMAWNSVSLPTLNWGPSHS